VLPGMRAADPGESRAALYGSNVFGVLVICGVAMTPAGYGLLAAFANVFCL